MAYHKQKIEKGKFGEFSKIKEEIDELLDAHDQKSDMLVLCELCDIIGAIEGYTTSKFNITLEELIKFSRMTQESFKDGTRINFEKK